MSERRSNLFVGALCVLFGLIAAFAIYARPEGLKVPAPVGYAAASAFMLAGLVIFAIETGRKSLYAWLVVGLLFAMFTPAAWIAFGPGERVCAVTPALLEFGASGAVCRTAFGAGALVLALMIVVAFRAALASKNAT